jgi:hypothetical protein
MKKITVEGLKNMINEVKKTESQSIAAKNFNENGKASKETYSGQAKKIGEYNKVEKEPEPNEYIESVQPTNDELANLIKHDGGMEMLNYSDSKGNKEFIKRNKENIVGDGSNESNKKFYEDSLKANDKEQELYNKTTGIKYGADFEFPTNSDKKPTKTAFKEGVTKRLVFKKEFKDAKHALSLIPESFKQEGLIFEMFDGNSLYKVEWKNNILKHHSEPVILKETHLKKIDETIKRMNELAGYKYASTSTSYGNKKQVNEGVEVQKMIDMLRG